MAGTQVRRLSKGVNSCISGRNKDGIVLSLRGTNTGSTLDWLQNAAMN